MSGICSKVYNNGPPCKLHRPNAQGTSTCYPLCYHLSNMGVDYISGVRVTDSLPPPLKDFPMLLQEKTYAVIARSLLDSSGTNQWKLHLGRPTPPWARHLKQGKHPFYPWSPSPQVSKGRFWRTERQISPECRQGLLKVIHNSLAGIPAIPEQWKSVFNCNDRKVQLQKDRPEKRLPTGSPMLPHDGSVVGTPASPGKQRKHAQGSQPLQPPPQGWHNPAFTLQKKRNTSWCHHTGWPTPLWTYLATTIIFWAPDSESSTWQYRKRPSQLWHQNSGTLCRKRLTYSLLLPSSTRG